MAAPYSPPGAGIAAAPAPSTQAALGSVASLSTPSSMPGVGSGFQAVLGSAMVPSAAPTNPFLSALNMAMNPSGTNPVTQSQPYASYSAPMLLNSQGQRPFQSEINAMQTNNQITNRGNKLPSSLQPFANPNPIGNQSPISPALTQPMAPLGAPEPATDPVGYQGTGPDFAGGAVGDGGIGPGRGGLGAGAFNGMGGRMGNAAIGAGGLGAGAFGQNQAGRGGLGAGAFGQQPGRGGLGFGAFGQQAPPAIDPFVQPEAQAPGGMGRMNVPAAPAPPPLIDDGPPMGMGGNGGGMLEEWIRRPRPQNPLMEQLAKPSNPLQSLLLDEEPNGLSSDPLKRRPNPLLDQLLRV